VQGANLVETSKHAKEHINGVLPHSKAILDKSKEVARTQAKLREQQA